MNHHHPPPQQHDPKKETFHRRGLLTCVILSTFFFVGAIFGWGPMQLLLEEEGIFLGGDCSSSTTVTATCSEEQQTTRLLQVQFVASATQVTAPIWGQFLDQYGAPRTFGLVVLFVVSGILVLIATLVLDGSDSFIYVGFILLALGSWCGGLLMVPVGLYFTGATRNRVIILLNALFDSSAMTYWILWSLKEYLGIELVGVLGVYFMIAVVLLVPGVYFWCVAVPQVEEEKKMMSETLPEEVVVVEKEKGETVPDGSAVSTEETDDTNHELATVEPEETTTPSQQAQDYIPVAERTPNQQLRAYPTLLLMGFFGIQVGINLWTLTTTRDFLAHLGDDAYNNRYLTIFTLLTPVSLLGTPAVDGALRKFGYPGAFQCINLLSLGSLVIRVSSTNLNVQILGFVLFSFYRSFLFGVTFSYVPTLLSADMVGRMTGVLYLISGIASFLNIPMARLAIQRHDGDFFVTNMIYTVLLVPCVLAAWGMGRADQLERRSKKLNA